MPYTTPPSPPTSSSAAPRLPMDRRADRLRTRGAPQLSDAAGGWKRYVQAHSTRLAPIIAKVFPHAARLPPELVAHIVDLWAHVGYY